MSETVHFSPGPSMPFVPGVVVDGKYRLERAIGRGGMGFIVLGRHVQLDQPVAVKFMHAWLAHTVPKGAARFLDEARAAACIHSDHVARVSDTGTFQGSPYMVMEYLEGENLEAFLQKQPILPVALAVRYALQAIEGLGEAHAAGIVHRDLKPANLFLARQSDGSIRIKLLDFGISKMVGGAKGPNPAWDGADAAEAEEMNAAICGSPLYMAPEQMLSSSKTDPRTDIWALGVVLYEMLVGVRPFIGDTLADLCARVMEARPEPLRTLRPEVPAVLESAVMQCLQKDPTRRFQNVSALAHALASGWPGATRAAARIDRIVNGRPTRISRPDPVEAAALVPQGELTRTSFNRAVDGLADLMNVNAGPPRGPEKTPPPVAAQIIELDDVEILFQPRILTWIRQGGSRLRGALRRPAAPVSLDPSMTMPSLLKSARIERKQAGIAALVVATGLAAALLLFIVRATPSSGHARAVMPTAAAPASSTTPPQAPEPAVAAPPVAAPEAWTPVPPPVSAAPWDASAARVDASPSPPPATARARSASPPAAPAATPRASATPGRSPAAMTRAAPVGTAGFGGRE
jgi:serine/threonine protein kinase